MDVLTFVTFVVVVSTSYWVSMFIIIYHKHAYAEARARVEQNPEAEIENHPEDQEQVSQSTDNAAKARCPATIKEEKSVDAQRASNIGKEPFQHALCMDCFYKELAKMESDAEVKLD